MKDGWHIVRGHEVYVENNRILFGTDSKHTKTLYPYQSTKNGMENAIGVNVYTFRNNDYYHMR